LSVVSLLTGSIVGTAQWLVLRRYTCHARWWILATILGFTVGSGAGWAVDVAVRPWSHDTLGLSVGLWGGGAVGGTVIGTAQWFFLRRLASRAVWWVLANAVAMAMVMFMGDVFWRLGDWEMMLGLVLFLPLLGLAFGFVTGTTLALLWRGPAPEPVLPITRRSIALWGIVGLVIVIGLPLVIAPRISPELMLTINEYSTALALSPNGDTIASGNNAGTIYMWRTSDGTLIRTLQGLTGVVMSIAFSPDGSTLASGSGQQNPNVGLWRVADGTLFKALTGPRSGVEILVFPKDGTRIVSKSGGKTVRLWAVEAVQTSATDQK
jgi:hypothetical protein